MFTGRSWEIALGVTATIVGAGGIGIEAASLLALPKLFALPAGILRAIRLCCMKLADVWDMFKAGATSRVAQASHLFHGGIELIRGTRPAAGVLAQLKQFAKRAVDDLRKNWVRDVLFTAIAALALSVIGFAPAGVAAVSLAARAQSYFYGGQTCGLFSLLQSLGASFVMPSLGTLVLAGIAAVASVSVVCDAISWVWSWWKSRT